jgi:WXXGXW repeat (2 copies)
MTRTSFYRSLTWLPVAALSGCIVTAPPAPPQYAAAPPPPPQYAASEEQASEPPPPLPEYDQPPVPEPGYIWTPGVWQWGPQGYYWVPGTWVAPPQVGLLWTPGFWAIAGGVYLFHRGYWGPHVGYYGGINYGGGYVGNGYAGGRWAGNNFQYNTAVTNVNVTNIHNTYNQTVINNVNVTNVTNVTRVSYVGAPGTRTQMTPEESAAARETHVPPTPVQTQHINTARTNPELNATRNQGRPPIAATPRPNAYAEHGVTQAKPGGPAYHPQQPAQHAHPEERRDEHPQP